MTAYFEHAPVLVRFPLPGQDSDRDSWPWLPGAIIAVCGEDEWQVCVEDPGCNKAGPGPPAPD